MEDVGRGVRVYDGFLRLSGYAELRPKEDVGERVE